MQNYENGIILVGHGSRREDANQEWEEIWKCFSNMHPTSIIQRAYIAFCHPTLQEAIELMRLRNVRRIILVPLFLTTGRHLFEEIPNKVQELQAQYPDMEFVQTEHIGPDRLLLQIIENRVQSTGILQEVEGNVIC